MKQFMLRMAKTKAMEFAAFSFQNEIRVLLSWVESPDFFDIGSADMLYAICAIADDKLEDFKKSDYYKFVKHQ